MAKLREATASQVHPAPQIADHVEQQLQAAYSEVLHEPIPARFLNVLDGLERQNSPAVQTSARTSVQKRRARIALSEAKI
jgi:hypothetical protein